MASFDPSLLNFAPAAEFHGNAVCAQGTTKGQLQRMVPTHASARENNLPNMGNSAALSV